MMVRRLRIERAGGPLRLPVANARARWSSRTGIRLLLQSDDGLIGQGEASPLPGYSPESVEVARAALETACGGTVFEVDERGPWGAQVDAAVEAIPRQIPSARFALETALLDLVGQRAGIPLDRLLGETHGPLAWAGLIGASLPSVALDRARRLLETGVRTLKVKVNGALGLEPVMPFLRELRSVAGDGVRIRLDANRSIPSAELGLWLSELASIDPEFIEEPSHPASIALSAPSPVPLALDETLHGGDAEAQLKTLVGSFGGATSQLRYAVVVLKPTVLGGLRCCARLAALARRSGAGVIVSHTFEGPIGWTACAALALAVGDASAAAGLEPHVALEAWPHAELPNLDGLWIAPHGRPGLGLDARWMP